MLNCYFTLVIFLYIALLSLISINMFRVLYNYAFITTLPPLHIFKSSIFDIVLSNLISIVNNNGIIIIYFQNGISQYNISCRECKFFKINKYYNILV